MKASSLRGFALALFFFALAAAGCSNTGQPSAAKDGSSRTGGTTELVISAAASLTDALAEIQRIFESEHRDIKLRFNLGSSGALKQQIEQGAPVDLFFSASDKHLDSLVAQRMIDPDRHAAVLRNALVMVVPSDATLLPASIDQLMDGKYRTIAVGDPVTVPAGSYTKEALEASKLWKPLEGKLVFGKDVRQVLSYVESGNADAGFVYATDALTSKRVKQALEVDAALHSPAIYPLGIVRFTKQRSAAEAAYAFLRSEKALGVFVKYGFSSAAKP